MEDAIELFAAGDTSPEMILNVVNALADDDQTSDTERDAFMTGYLCGLAFGCQKEQADVGVEFLLRTREWQEKGYL